MSAAGQVLPLELIPGLDAALTELEVTLAEQRTVHGRLLRRVLAVGQVLTRGGCELGGPAQVALVLNVSETTAEHLLVQAELLTMLPGGLEALDSGLLGVEQAGAFTRAVTDLPIDVVRAVWQQLRDRLIRDASCGGVLPPARLKALVAGWVIAADPDAAVDRRRQAQDQAAVDYRKRDDGLVDLFAIGLTGPNAQAILTRIRARAAAWGAGDERPAGRRRLEGLVDLILGRDQLPVPQRDDVPVFCHRPRAADRSCKHDRSAHVCAGHSPRQEGEPAGQVRPCGPACGCRLGQPTPCGIDVRILIPLGAALGRTGELAQLVGHGPLEPDLTAAALSNRPRLFPVWVDHDGTPVAAGTRPVTPDPNDPDGLTQALLALAALPPPALQPAHPHDHPFGPPPGRPPDPSPTDPSPTVPSPTPTTAAPSLAAPTLTRPGLAEQVTGPHPAGDPGTYRVSDRLRLLTILRAPLCEWPGCGHQAQRCDQDHDKAWPHGATCACNIGPLCRRHHRVKQLLWIKERLPGNIVAWTDPTGRTWRNPSPHQPPVARPAQDPAGVGDLERRELERLTVESDALGLSLSPQELREQLWLEEHDGRPPDLPDPFAPGQVLDDRPELVRARELSALHPDDPHRKASFWVTGPAAGTDPWRHDQPWGFDLDNPYSWD